MSEIRATTISDSAGTGPITLTGQSAAKAWCNWNGTGTAAIRDSFNTTSITDNGIGDYTFTITNNLSDTNYSVTTCSQYYQGGATASAALMGLEIKHTTTAMQAGNITFWHRYGPSTTLYDCTTGCFTINGDLA